MKTKFLITALLSLFLFSLSFPVVAEGELYIDTKTVYDGMTCSYS